VNQNLQNQLKTPLNKPGIRVRIPWAKGDTIYRWDLTCIWALENFGLPGDRYITHPTEEYMDFYFNDSEDAVLFSLRWL
jgi:hypothetical protein